MKDFIENLRNEANQVRRIIIKAGDSLSVEELASAKQCVMDSEAFATSLQLYVENWWTKITDKPESLPEIGRRILLVPHLAESRKFSWSEEDQNRARDGIYYGCRWRYFDIPGIDYPEKLGQIPQETSYPPLPLEIKNEKFL